jgi:acetyl-CoA C-acetyltransferase
MTTTTRRAAIVAPVRTPVGTFGGSLRAVPVEDLAATAIKAVLERTGIDPELIDDVSFAQSYVNGETPCIGRWAALHAGLPESVPGLQIDRRCGGGLQAVITAAMMVQTGAADVVLAGGAESMSNAEHYTTSVRWGARAGNQVLYDRIDRGRERSQPPPACVNSVGATAATCSRPCASAAARGSPRSSRPREGHVFPRKSNRD